MLSVLVFLPLAVAALLLALPTASDRAVRVLWTGTAAVEVVLLVGLWVAYRRSPPEADGFAFQTDVRWIPAVGSRYHVGVDGLSLPVVAVTVVLFLGAAIYAGRDRDQLRSYAALVLFLQTTCLGLFVALDLILFFVFFDLSIVGMYFVILGWGAEKGRRSAALMFFLYTFLGSLALLVGFIGLYLAADPHTFDMVELARQNPLATRGVFGAVVLGAVLLGLAVKTPVFPLHSWLPPAHTSAPAEGSAILAGVLLKMGTYGFVRIGMPLLPQAWRAWAWVIVIVGVISVLYGALVALAQTDLKRMIAYTSVNHMGYIVLAVGAAGLSPLSDQGARTLAINGAMFQMVSHGLVTGPCSCWLGSCTGGAAPTRSPPTAASPGSRHAFRHCSRSRLSPRSACPGYPVSSRSSRCSPAACPAPPCPQPWPCWASCSPPPCSSAPYNACSPARSAPRRKPHSPTSRHGSSPPSSLC